MSTAVIVQARMSSTRLSGKVMKKLGKKTILAHVLERCLAVTETDQVWCATVDGSDGDQIEAEARRCGVNVFRGSESDVLGRYLGAAKAAKAEVILRVTSDCPMIDPEICSDVLRLRKKSNADYACNNMPRGWPHGLDCEAFTMKWLDRAAREAVASDEREHVTPFIRKHPDAVRVNLAGPAGGLEQHRWTLDTQDDFDFMVEMFKHLPAGPKGWDYKSVLGVLDANPHLVDINAKHRVQ